MVYSLQVYGYLPSRKQLEDWEFGVSQHSAVPQGVLVCLFINLFYHHVYN